jgi:hypothetical protein
VVGRGSNAVVRCLKQTPVMVVSIKYSEGEKGTLDSVVVIRQVICTDSDATTGFLSLGLRRWSLVFGLACEEGKW